MVRFASWPLSPWSGAISSTDEIQRDRICRGPDFGPSPLLVFILEDEKSRRKISLQSQGCPGFRIWNIYFHQRQSYHFVPQLAVVTQIRSLRKKLKFCGVFLSSCACATCLGVSANANHQTIVNQNFWSTYWRTEVFFVLTAFCITSQCIVHEKELFSWITYQLLLPWLFLRVCSSTAHTAHQCISAVAWCSTLQSTLKLQCADAAAEFDDSWVFSVQNVGEGCPLFSA